MSARYIDVAGRRTAVCEAGSGAPLVYLHGFADVHAAPDDFLPFHDRLARHRRIVAPAHPGCAGGAELVDGHQIDDMVFHLLETFDALGLDRFDLVGHCVGGWFAAEFASRHPERVKSLILIDACGLFVAGSPTGDVFMHAQAERGVDYATLRHLLFRSADAPLALEWFPNGKGDIDLEVRRYEMLRFSSFVGFKPPYFYNRSLERRLARATMPSLVLWGENDHMTSIEHGRAYAKALPGCVGLTTIPGAGHALVAEEPEAAAREALAFLAAR